jgi:hypothetical protein
VNEMDTSSHAEPTAPAPTEEPRRPRLDLDTGFRRLGALAFAAVGGFVFLSGLFHGWFWQPLFAGLFMGGLAYALVRGLGWAVRGFLHDA